MAYIAEDGSYGAGNVIVIENDALTEQQWETLEYLPDDCRYWYVNAILSDDIEAVEELESAYL